MGRVSRLSPVDFLLFMIAYAKHVERERLVHIGVFGEQERHHTGFHPMLRSDDLLMDLFYDYNRTLDYDQNE